MKLQQYFFWLASVTLTFYLLIVAKNVLIPLVLAVFIWYLVNVLTDFIDDIRIGSWQPSSGLAFTVAILAILSVLTLLVGLVSNNIAQVVEAAPGYQRNLERLLARGYSLLQIEEAPDLNTLFSNVSLSSVVSQTAGALTSFMGDAGLIAAYLFFLFVEEKFFPAKLKALIPDPERRARVARILARIDKDTRTYIGIKTFVSLLAAGLCYAVLAFVGLDFAEFWALLIFILHFIPNIGFLVATALPSMLALVQFETLNPFLIVTIGLLAVQLGIANLLEPRLMGTSLNLSPLVIILALVVWGTLWGISGMFLCVPIMVIALIIFSHFPQTRGVAVLLSADGQLKDHDPPASAPAPAS